MKFPLIALVVSGGHTELVYMKEDYSFEKIGSTLDDAVGEAYDKVARVINVPYPGGPTVDKLAHIGNNTYNEESSIQNLIISQGLSSTKKDDNDYFELELIPITVFNQDYEIKVARNSKGELKIYCEADLIA